VNAAQAKPLESTAASSGNPSISEELLLDCVHCGLCSSACPTYLETGDENNSPRGRLYLMRALQEEHVELNPAVQNHLDLCLDCRGCESACPSGVQYGRLIEEFRVGVQQSDSPSRPQLSGFQRLVLTKLLPFPKRIWWSLLPLRILQSLGIRKMIDVLGMQRLLTSFLSRMYRSLPEKLSWSTTSIPEFFPAIGEKRASVALFSGCVSPVLDKRTLTATITVLQHNGCDVHVPKTQGCCGALHLHNGFLEGTRQFAKNNVIAFDSEEYNAVIVPIAGCGATLKEYGKIFAAENHPQREFEQYRQFSEKVKDISEFLVELGPIPPKRPLEKKVYYHPACHLRHAQKIVEQPKLLLRTIPGLTLVECLEDEICCGAAGTYQLFQPEMSARLLKRKIDLLTEREINLIVSPNIGCTLQLKNGFRDRGIKMEVFHPVELLANCYD